MPMRHVRSCHGYGGPVGLGMIADFRSARVLGSQRALTAAVGMTADTSTISVARASRASLEIMSLLIESMVVSLVAHVTTRSAPSHRALS
jgi:hypothetical protein